MGRAMVGGAVLDGIEMGGAGLHRAILISCACQVLLSLSFRNLVLCVSCHYCRTRTDDNRKHNKFKCLKKFH